MVHVVGLQARRIQRYVFNSPQLRHMVGASDLVETLCTVRPRQLLRSLGAPVEALRVAAAGKAWLQLDDGGVARRFVELFPALADLHAPGLAVDVALGEGADEQTAYEAANRTLQRLGGLPRVVCAELSPLVDRARHTGDPAIGRVPRPEGSQLVDAAMARQETVGREAQERLRQALETRGDLRWPTDLDELASAGEAQPIAVLHADGNGFGQVLDRLSKETTGGAQPLEIQRTLSEAIRTASTAALRAAVTGLYREAEGTGVVPGRPILFGGDDLTLVVRADCALELTRAYLEAFERETEAALGPVLAVYGLPPSAGRLTACAGLAVVKRTCPFSRAYDLAESLCGWAKARSRRVAGPGGAIPSSLAVHRVTASIVGDYAEVLDTDLRCSPGRRDSRPALQLAAGPYTVGEGRTRGLRSLRDLEALADQLSRLARGPRRRLLTDLKRDPDQAHLAWRRMLQVGGPGSRAIEAARQALDGTSSLDELEETSLLDAYVLDFLRPTARVTGRTTS